MRAVWGLFAVLTALAGGGGILTARGEDVPAYDRGEWLPDWSDEDGNCRDTRQEVLARESFPGTVEWDAAGCRVVKGYWRDPYSGEFRREPAWLDIDHVVPLAWAHAHGGATWPTARKRAFANDLRYRGALVATTAAMNRSKRDKGPAHWIPPRDGIWACEYGQAWSVITTMWGLTVDPIERDAIRLLVMACR